ncbi:uncharacterized protein LOC132197577 [Neocloeon triangulifer]|uniref:uncharacterized protein LOC132197577 n=1 Tax=Neocloeon triangulifer TaxID=2078957 RepID=UPI00286EC11C|nr:uncharacterized protein LOC132197577 [Neocloeon triangulifer]
MFISSRVRNVEKPKESIEIELLPQKESRTEHLSFGHKLLSVMHLIFGQHLRVPPLDRNLGLCWNIIFTFHSSAIYAVGIFCTISAFFALRKNLNNFGNAIFVAAGFIGSLECVVRHGYSLMQKNKIEMVVAKIHHNLYHQNLETDPLPFVKRLSRVITIFIAVIVVVFAITLATGYITVFLKLATILDGLMKDNPRADADQFIRESNFSVEINEAWTYTSQVFYVWRSVTLMRIVCGIIHFYSFFAIGRIMISDLLFYTWYSTIIHQYRQLAKELPKVMEKRAGKDKLQDWINCHQSLNELLKEINCLTSPVIVLGVITTGLQICILSFVMLKLFSETNVFISLVYAISTLQKLVVYCVLGQKLKDSADSLHAEAYKGPWIDNADENNQHIALMVMASSEKNRSCLPGAPFFSMSLEFLASMASAIFTYFIVLIQLNKN